MLLFSDKSIGDPASGVLGSPESEDAEGDDEEEGTDGIAIGCVIVLVGGGYATKSQTDAGGLGYVLLWTRALLKRFLAESLELVRVARFQAGSLSQRGLYGERRRSGGV